MAQNSLSKSVKKWKKCYHFDSNENCKNIIRTHTIQRQGILREINNTENHCLTLMGLKMDQNELPILREIGSRNATTFFGFCQKHDAMFSSIEDGNFTPTRKNLLLAAYRAASYEFHQKEAWITALKEQQALILMMKNDPSAIMWLNSMQSGLKNAQYWWKEIANALSGKQDPLNHMVIEVHGRPHFLASGMISPGIMGSGPRLAEFGGQLPKDGVVFVSVHKSNKSYSWSFSYPKHDNIASDFTQLINKNTASTNESILPNLLSTYCEHTFFSHEWWDTLNFDERTELRRNTIDLYDEANSENIMSLPLPCDSISAYFL